MLAEGNVFQNVDLPVEAGVTGQLFTAPSTSANTACSASVGRVCVVNAFGSSGAFSQSDTSFLVNFAGKNIASAAAATTVVASVSATAGFGLI